MLRLLLVLVAGLSLMMMLSPTLLEQGTEMYFAPGDPDPNIYSTWGHLGRPFEWLTWYRERSEGRGFDRSEIVSFHLVNCMFYLAAIALPVCLLSRRGRQGADPVNGAVAS
jgi:hypothetical protein